MSLSKSNSPNPVPPSQDGTSHRGNPDSSPLSPAQHYVVAHYGLYHNSISHLDPPPSKPSTFPNSHLAHHTTPFTLLHQTQQQQQASTTINKTHLRTFPGNITRNRPPATQPHPRHLPLRRIRLLRLEIVDDAQTDALHVRSVYQSWGDRMPGSLRLAGFFEDLH